MQYRDGQTLPLEALNGAIVPLRLTVNPRARRVSIRIDARGGQVVAVAPRERLLGDAVAFARSRMGWIVERMKARVEGQVQAGKYGNSSDYVRDLIRRDQERSDKIAAMQRFVDDGLKSGIGDRSKDELFAAALSRADTPRGNG